ncbi:putative sugar nucleotidyl transferase [Gemmatimonadota bacterium]
MTASLFLFDDEVARHWEPFLLTRPAGELLFGALLLRERAERFWGVRCEGYLSRDALDGFSEEGSPPLVDTSAVPDRGVRALLSSRAALTGAPPPIPQAGANLVLGGELVGWILPDHYPAPSPENLLTPGALSGLPTLEVQGQFLDAPWDLMHRNGDQLREDIPRFFPGYAAAEVPGSHMLGDGLLSLGRDVEVEPGTVFDLREGPIRLSDEVVIRAHTRLAGPAWVGPGSTLLGGVVSEVSVGPVCKVRGEVESSVILGYGNKGHDGFLGHAYLGRWVNLGAFTTNSDLKNNYGEVRIGSPQGHKETGLMKVGCFLGDHVKTGIGTLLNTGTVVGAGSNLFGGRMPSSYVPAFTWGTGEDLTEYHLDQFLEVTARAMGRRSMELTPGMEALLRQAWEDTRPQRTPGG